MKRRAKRCTEKEREGKRVREREIEREREKGDRGRKKRADVTTKIQAGRTRKKRLWHSFPCRRDLLDYRFAVKVLARGSGA